MTTEEFNKYMPRLGAYLYACNAVEAVNNQTGNTVIISERECVALACGVNAAHVISFLTPNKPVDTMTDEDIARDAESIFKSLADLYELLEAESGDK